MTIREHLAAALHADRDHTRDGCELGNEPICNCYTLADKAIEALGGVKRVREYGTYIPATANSPSLMMLDYPLIQATRDPRWWVGERIGYSTPMTEETPA